MNTQVERVYVNAPVEVPTDRYMNIFFHSDTTTKEELKAEFEKYTQQNNQYSIEKIRDVKPPALLYENAGWSGANMVNGEGFVMCIKGKEVLDREILAIGFGFIEHIAKIKR